MSGMLTSSSISTAQNPKHLLKGDPAPTIVWILFGVAVLYLGRGILLPLALAATLALILRPIASLLARPFGNFASSVLVILIAIGFLVAAIWFFAVELNAVANEMADYPDEIAAKLVSLENKVFTPFQQIERTVESVQKQIAEKPRGRRPAVVQASPMPPSIADRISPALPVVTTIADSVFILVLLFFLLYGRADLRDRAVRLFARAGVLVAGEAIDFASETVSRYLLLFTLMNLMFGTAIGVVTWLLGLQRPMLWGSLASVLRYVPYIGALISGALPTMVALAVFPGWVKAAEVLAAFVVLDQVIAQFIEPFWVGAGVGLSPVALVVAAVFWTWLWGPIGLILSTPLSACLKVAGDYVPALGFFYILLAADPVPQEFHGYYRKLLMFDRQGARGFVEAYCNEFGLARTTSRIFVPALDLAALETAQGKIGAVNERFIVETTKQLTDELADKLKT
jgi:predicted PurR-regulated permease PerM